MTGEMADLFPNRREGVARIVAALRQWLSDVDLRFYAGVEGFVAADRAAAAWQQIASANWRASGAVVAARVPVGSFIDIGSTTTDILVVRDGRVLAHGGDDGARLVTGELVYTGVVRTPVMVLADRVPFEGQWVPVMAELFATTADVHRLTGRLPERADQHPAADGGDKTVAGSARRLARMIGRDVESAPLESWRGLADWLAAAQVRRIHDAWARLRALAGISEEAPLVLAGVGRFLAPDLPGGLRNPVKPLQLSGRRHALEPRFESVPHTRLSQRASRQEHLPGRADRDHEGPHGLERTFHEGINRPEWAGAASEQHRLGDLPGEIRDLAVERACRAPPDRAARAAESVYDAAALDGESRAERPAQLEQH